MAKKRKRRKPEQIVKLLQDGEAMLAAGKSLADVYQKLEVTESTWQRWKKQSLALESVKKPLTAQAAKLNWPATRPPRTLSNCKLKLYKPLFQA